MTEKTFENFDKLNRKVFADRLIKAITTFSPFHDEAYVLSLNATFGGGKSTFLEMWENDLTSAEKGYTVIRINAWETDFDDEPIIPIASSLINQLKGKKSEAVRKGLSQALGVLGYALEKITGHNADEFEDKIKANDLEAQGNKISKAFLLKKGVYEGIKASLQQYSDELDNKPLIIMVDELDRVRPDYAVKFLEAIKHIFSVKGICFVLAIDRQQLEVSVKQLYGNEIDFDNYFLRFITREVDLPEACTENLEPFIRQVAEEFFNKKTSSANVAFIFKDDEQKEEVLKYAITICAGLKLRPRQIEAIFRQYSQFIAVDNEGQSYRTSWLKAPFFLISLKVSGRMYIYQQISDASYNPQNLLELVNGFYFPNLAEGPMGQAIEETKIDFLWNTLPFLFTGAHKEYQDQAVSIMNSLVNPDQSDDYGRRFEISDGEILRTLLIELSNTHPIHNSAFQSKFQDFQRKIDDWSGFLG